VSLAAVLGRAANRPHARLLLLAAAAAAVALLLAAPGELASAASRGALVAAGLGAVAVLVRRAPARAPLALRVVSRAALAREAGVAVLELEGRRLLVGWGAGGVRVLSRLEAASDVDGLAPVRGLRPGSGAGPREGVQP
jgi:flagellar protein FliO/FliZ